MDILMLIVNIFVGGFVLGVSASAFSKKNWWGGGFWFMIAVPFIVMVGKMFV